MNIKAIWFCVSLAASACVGAGIMAAVAPLPVDTERTVRQTQDCETTEADRAYMSSKVIRSQAKEF